MTTTLHDQILDAIKATLKLTEQIAAKPTFQNLLKLNECADDLYTLAKQGDEYNRLVIDGIKDEWLKFSVINQVKTLLKDGVLPPDPTESTDEISSKKQARMHRTNILKFFLLFSCFYIDKLIYLNQAILPYKLTDTVNQDQINTWEHAK